MGLLILQHVDCEGPGYIEDFAASRQLKAQTIRLYDSASIPDPREFKAMIIMGGPMNVYEEDRYPWLGRENQAILTAIAEGIPCFGICLGSQLLAKALGAPIRRNTITEIGFGSVRLTPQASQDPLFSGFPEAITVFHWHEDTWDLPPRATLLASSDGCPHQAFRYGKHYGIQFHVETTPAMISTWIEEYSSQIRSCGLENSVDRIRTEAQDQAENLRSMTLSLIENFWEGVVNPRE